jgi:radical SAM protein with 4Fe4S-binding SPASM domain
VRGSWHLFRNDIQNKSGIKMADEKFNVGWGLTNKCNMKCEFCYSENARRELEDCGIEDWKAFVDKNAEFIDSINYGTGENAIIDEFFHFVKYVRENYPQIKQSLTTNGYVGVRAKQNPEFMEVFKNSIDELDVSVDFNDPERHAKFRGQPYAFDWANQTLELNEQLGKLSTIVFVGFDETCTKENLAGLFELAKTYNALLRMNIYRPVNKDDTINRKFILSYNKLKEALKYIYQIQEIVSLSDILLGNVFAGDRTVKDNTGTNSIRILPDGTICPSTYLISEKHRSDTTIRNTDLSTLQFEQFQDIEIPKECGTCKYEDSCKGGVYDRRILWYNTFAERDPYCPTRNDDEVQQDTFTIKKLGRVSVHDGYLPTMFFKNKSEPKIGDTDEKKVD